MLTGSFVGEFFPGALRASRDGLALAVGSALASPQDRAGAGAVYILRAGPDSASALAPAKQISGALAGDRFGSAAAWADIDGDGSLDLLAITTSSDGTRTTLLGVAVGD
jgi:hypothetical protein